MRAHTSRPYQRPDMTEWARCSGCCRVPAALSLGKPGQDKPDSRLCWSIVSSVYGRRALTAAPAKAKMSHAVNRRHVKQLTNVTSSSDVASGPSEDKTGEGYEGRVQVTGLFRRWHAAVINPVKALTTHALAVCRHALRTTFLSTVLKIRLTSICVITGVHLA